MTFAEHQALLVGGVNSAAATRAEDAAEHPDDPRYIDSSRALETLAARLKELPPDHPKLRRLWQLQFGLTPPDEIDALDLFLNYSIAQGKVLARYGLNTPEKGDPEKYLTDLIATVQLEVLAFDFEPDDMSETH